MMNVFTPSGKLQYQFIDVAQTVVPFYVLRVIGGTIYLIGALVGAVSNRFFLTCYQQILSIVLGSFILFILVVGKFINLEFTVFRGFYLRVQTLLAKYLHGQKSTTHFYCIGIVNGLLPCGIVYMGVAATGATGTVANGAWLMLAFGLGTLPLMFNLMIVERAIPVAVKQQLRKALPYCIGLTAYLLILRGMNLGIPFLSPELNHTARGIINCQ